MATVQLKTARLAASEARYGRAMAQALEDLDRRATALEKAQRETTDTLKWVVAKLGRIQAVKDEHTLRLERIEARLELAEERIDSVQRKLDALPHAIAEMIAASEKRLAPAIAER